MRGEGRGVAEQVRGREGGERNGEGDKGEGGNEIHGDENGSYVPLRAVLFRLV